VLVEIEVPGMKNSIVTGTHYDSDGKAIVTVQDGILRRRKDVHQWS